MCHPNRVQATSEMSVRSYRSRSSRCAHSCRVAVEPRMIALWAPGRYARFTSIADIHREAGDNTTGNPVLFSKPSI